MGYPRGVLERVPLRRLLHSPWPWPRLRDTPGFGIKIPPMGGRGLFNWVPLRLRPYENHVGQHPDGYNEDPLEPGLNVETALLEVPTGAHRVDVTCGMLTVIEHSRSLH